MIDRSPRFRDNWHSIGPKILKMPNFGTPLPNEKAYKIGKNDFCDAFFFCFHSQMVLGT